MCTQRTRLAQAQTGSYSLNRYRPSVDRRPRKKPKHLHLSRPPPRFWDNLSKTPLIRGALGKLDRRNAVEHPGTPADDRPNTRTAAASRSFQSASAYLRRRRPRVCAESNAFQGEGGPDLSDLRGLQHDGTKSTGPYDRAFQQHLIDHSVFPTDMSTQMAAPLHLPDNLEELERFLPNLGHHCLLPRFTNDDFKKFEKEDAHATKEWQIVANVVPIIEGNIVDRKCVSGQIPFNNLDQLTDGSLVPGNPDRYYGARPEQLDRRIRADLMGFIVPSTQHDLPIMPNNILAVKGPDGSAAVAARQANYDGALGARGIQGVLSYGSSESQNDGNSRVITSTYHSGTLKMFTSHVKHPTHPGGRPDLPQWPGLGETPKGQGYKAGE
ncbi:hypothetical protein PG985_014784 [Apiospora marii]|uniref:uncharacterized protein n=1 Tax=Apiospora marii TaxID=335849 RepID=UPI00312D5693